MKIKPLEEQIEDWNNEEIIYGEPIEQREANYFDGYTQGIYRAKNIIDMQQKQIDQLTNNWNELRKRIKEYLEECENSDDEWLEGKCDMARDILYDMEEIKEGKNEPK